MSWNNIVQNIKGYTLKKFLAPILEHKLATYDELLDRIGTSLVTDNDLKTFGNLVNDIIAVGYLKAIEDYKKQLSDMGVQVTVKEPNQSEKLGW